MIIPSLFQMKWIQKLNRPRSFNSQNSKTSPDQLAARPSFFLHNKLLSSCVLEIPWQPGAAGGTWGAGRGMTHLTFTDIDNMLTATYSLNATGFCFLCVGFFFLPGLAWSSFSYDLEINLNSHPQPRIAFFWWDIFFPVCPGMFPLTFHKITGRYKSHF